MGTLGTMLGVKRGQEKHWEEVSLGLTLKWGRFISGGGLASDREICTCKRMAEWGQGQTCFDFEWEIRKLFDINERGEGTD